MFPRSFGRAILPSGAELGFRSQGGSMPSLLPAALVCVCLRVAGTHLCVCLCLGAAGTHKSLLRSPSPGLPRGLIIIEFLPHLLPTDSPVPARTRGRFSSLPSTRASRPKAQRRAPGLRPRSRRLEAGPKVGRASAGLGALFPGRHFGSLFTFAARRSPATWLSPAP